MNYLLLSAVVLFIPLQDVIKKPFTARFSGKGVYLFNSIISLVALGLFAVTSGGFKWNTAYLPYSVGFAVSYMAANIFTLLSLACGTVSLTALVNKYSLLVPTFYGMLLGEDISAFLIAGIVLLAVSLFLINKPQKGGKISVKWLIFVALAFAGNGMCSVTQKMCQQAFGDTYSNEFMMVALGLSFVASLTLGLATSRKDTLVHLKHGAIPAGFCGILNGAVNLFVMILNGVFNASMMFPLISAGGIIIVYFLSKWLYKEQLSTLQTVGLLVGIASVVLLNL